MPVYLTYTLNLHKLKLKNWKMTTSKVINHITDSNIHLDCTNMFSSFFFVITCWKNLINLEILSTFLTECEIGIWEEQWERVNSKDCLKNEAEIAFKPPNYNLVSDGRWSTEHSFLMTPFCSTSILIHEMQVIKIFSLSQRKISLATKI